MADYVRAGMPAREARRRARLEFGGLDHVKEMCRDVRRTRWVEEMCRDVRRTRWVEDLAREVRYALRRQFTDRGSRVSLFAVVALAMGIGASTAMFGVLDAVVLQPLPFAQEERLVAGWKTSRTDTTRFIELSYPEFLGFDREGVLTAFVNPSRVRYPDAAARRRFFRDVIARLETNAEVEAAGAALLRPLEGVIGWDLPYRLPGQSPEDAAGNSILNLEVVTPTYFEAIGTALLAGRGFAETDGLYVARAEPDPAAPLAMESAAERQPPAAVESAVERQPLVAIVSESVAREMYGFPPDAVGRRFVGGRNAPRSYRIVGVVADGRYRRVREVSGDVFLPYTQTAIPLRYVVVRTSAGPAAARAILRRALAEVDPEQPMSADLTTTELVERALSRERFQSALLLPFGLGSALLAAIGVFGTVTDTANRRLRELALRLALGASRSRVLVRLVRSTVTCILLGSCVGILLAIAADRTLNLALFETALADPWIIVAVCSVVLGVALVACVGPAMRVLRLDVGAVLRQ